MRKIQIIGTLLVVVLLVFGACAPAPTPAPTPTPDTTPPSVITGLVAGDAYDGRVNLWWHQSTAEDFDHYNLYVSKSEIVDVSGMTPVHQLSDIATNNYQVTGLEVGIKYYFAVTAVDDAGNESILAISVRATPTVMPRGTVAPDIYVDVYHPDLVWAGTTLFSDPHNPERPRIIEVNMLGEIIWEYVIPKDGGYPADVELLPNNNILFMPFKKGVYEVNRKGEIVWSYVDEKVSHDADRLPNGNTIMVWGWDEISDAQVKEVNPKGEIVWTWYAKDHFNKSPYKDIYSEGWTHTNAVTRLENGNTLISLRNFALTVEVDLEGSVVWSFDWSPFGRNPHEPEVLPNGNVLIALRGPHRVVEIDPKTGKIVWEFSKLGVKTIRDADRLPNGNTLIVERTEMLEVTPDKKVVWQLGLKGVSEEEKILYKAERIGTQR